MNFIVGFEFEFGWLVNKPFTYDVNLGPSVFKDVKNSLKSFLKDGYSHVFEIVDDHSILFLDSKLDYYGVEVVTKPMPEAIATKFCNDFLKWMNENPSVSTNKTCSLHVNISIKEKKLNEKIDHFALLNNTPQNDILNKFNRQHNEYCKPTNSQKFSLNIEKLITQPKNLDFWLNKVINKPFSIQTNNRKQKIWSKTSNTSTTKVVFEDKNESLNLIKNSLINNLKNDNLTAIVEKSFKSIRYFEFRMIGNKDYHKKFLEIHKTINIYKKSLKKSLI